MIVVDVSSFQGVVKMAMKIYLLNGTICCILCHNKKDKEIASKIFFFYEMKLWFRQKNPLICMQILTLFS